MSDNYSNTKSIVEILGLSNSDSISLELLKHKYRVLCKKYHPDTCSEEYKDGSMFRMLKEAYDYAADNIDDIKAYFDRNNITPPQMHNGKPYRRPNDFFGGFYYPAEKVKDNRPFNLEKCIWEPIISSNLEYVYYDSSRRYLFVLFQSTRGYVYCYVNVDFDEYQRLMTSKSKGTYMNTYIIPYYRCLKLEYYRSSKWKPDSKSDSKEGFFSKIFHKFR